MRNRLLIVASQRFVYNTTTGVLSYSADGSGAARSTVVASDPQRRLSGKSVLHLIS
jgi:hypothetical protein